jgi:hypothetical protein
VTENNKAFHHRRIAILYFIQPAERNYIAVNGSLFQSARGAACQI